MSAALVLAVAAAAAAAAQGEGSERLYREAGRFEPPRKCTDGNGQASACLHLINTYACMGLAVLAVA